MSKDAPPEVPPNFFQAPPDPELAAIAACFRALLPLDREARNRVLEYIDARLLGGDETVDVKDE